MRETRLSGSEGGGARTRSPYPYPSLNIYGHTAIPLASRRRVRPGPVALPQTVGLQRVKK